jgi:hypothetical protein
MRLQRDVQILEREDASVGMAGNRRWHAIPRTAGRR